MFSAPELVASTTITITKNMFSTANCHWSPAGTSIYARQNVSIDWRRYLSKLIWSTQRSIALFFRGSLSISMTEDVLLRSVTVALVEVQCRIFLERYAAHVISVQPIPKMGRLALGQRRIARKENVMTHWEAGSVQPRPAAQKEKLSRSAKNHFNYGPQSPSCNFRGKKSLWFDEKNINDDY
jgi:hypothetical protein